MASGEVTDGSARGTVTHPGGDSGPAAAARPARGGARPRRRRRRLAGQCHRGPDGVGGRPHTRAVLAAAAGPARRGADDGQPGDRARLQRLRRRAGRADPRARRAAARRPRREGGQRGAARRLARPAGAGDRHRGAVRAPAAGPGLRARRAVDAGSLSLGDLVGGIVNGLRSSPTSPAPARPPHSRARAEAPPPRGRGLVVVRPPAAASPRLAGAQRARDAVAPLGHQPAQRRAALADRRRSDRRPAAATVGPGVDSSMRPGTGTRRRSWRSRRAGGPTAPRIVGEVRARRRGR